MLENNDKKNPFSIPENYFQNFNSDIMNMLPDKGDIGKKKTISLWKSVNKWIATAAVITGMAFVGMYYLDNNAKTTTGGLTSASTAGVTDDNSTSIEDDYYLYLEDEATRIAYHNAFFDDDL